MTWNWQQPDWPEFSWNQQALEAQEARFLRNSGLLLGAFIHLSDGDRELLTVELMSTEALKTSEIEGEHLNRDSVQSSIRKQLGLAADARKAAPAERGIAEMMVGLYRSWETPLSGDMLCAWHAMLMQGRADLHDIGAFRTHEDAMQIVSGPLHKQKVHFEAPPSAKVPAEMKRFIAWFNGTGPGSGSPLSSLARAGAAHLYFESIHPFEDGNGRVGRAVSQKSLAQSQGAPALIALARTIERRRNDYYDALARANRSNEITDWLIYFADTVLAAQEETHRQIEFLIGKTKFYDRFRGLFNERQDKVLARMFREGPDGFTGGLSAENYIAIARTSRATATRDLRDLTTKGALLRSGELRHTRYFLNIPETSRDT